MPSKRKKTRKKQAKSNTVAAKRAKKAPRSKHATAAKKRVKKKQAKKKQAKKKQAKKKASSKASPTRVKKTSGRRAQLEGSGREGAVSVPQSTDLEGLSRVEQADSESVDELVDEGNVFEAGAVAGVEEADNEDTREVHTREVPEDDVPGEYLDKD